MNVTEVATRLKRTFGDESGIQILDADIIRWINDAQEQIVLDNAGLMEATGVASTVADQKQYSLPADLSVLRSLSFKGYHLTALSFNDFNNYVDGYQASVNNPYPKGIPEYYTVWNKSIWIHPVPEISETDSITIYYTKHCPVITTLADELGVPLQYHNAVVKFALAQAYELDENYEAKQMKEAEFTNDTTKLNDRNKWLNQEVYPCITILPEGGDYYYGG